MSVCPSQKIVGEDADRKRLIDRLDQVVIRQVWLCETPEGGNKNQGLVSRSAKGR